MTIAERLMVDAGCETERLAAKQKLFKLTGMCQP
jgi:hypothetical protein